MSVTLPTDGQQAPPPASSRTVAHPRWAMCLGGADCVWADVLALEDMLGRQWDGPIVIINDVGAHWPRSFDHWVTLHAAKMERWKQQRQTAFDVDGIMFWSGRKNVPLFDYYITAWPGGSSGLLAVQVAKAVGCSRVVLCGVPLTPTPHFAETQERHKSEWTAAGIHFEAWRKQRRKLDGWVKSMSGRTLELLGPPTIPWLNGAEE